MYDSTYGDMVPDIIANALNVKIIIVEKLGYDYICYCTCENVDMSTQLPLLWPLLLTWFNFNPSMDK